LTPAPYAEELEFARELADTAASISARWTEGDLGVRHKPDATPVTDTDVAIERALRAAVRARFPDDGFLGEEEGSTSGGPRTWVVDPIDGTRNLIDGIQLWTTLIALVDQGRPVVGLAHAPAVHERYEAVVGQGARLNGTPIHVSSVGSVGEAMVLHSGVEEWMRGPYWDGFRSLAGSSRRTRGVSDAWGHMLVARGSADVLLEHEPCGPWDWSAVQVIVEEAGGRLTTLDGSPPSPGCDLLSSNGVLHDIVIGELSGHAVAGR
jgi:histidinol-phosphatase